MLTDYVTRCRLALNTRPGKLDTGEILVRFVRLNKGGVRVTTVACYLLLILLPVVFASLASAQGLTRYGDVSSVTGDRVEISMIAPYRVKAGTEGYLFTTNTVNGRIKEVRAATIRRYGNQRFRGPGDSCMQASGPVPPDNK